MKSRYLHECVVPTEIEDFLNASGWTSMRRSGYSDDLYWENPAFPNHTFHWWEALPIAMFNRYRHALYLLDDPGSEK